MHLPNLLISIVTLAVLLASSPFAFAASAPPPLVSTSVQEKYYLGPVLGGFYFSGEDIHSLSPLVGARIGYEVPGSNPFESYSLEGTLNAFYASGSGGSGAVNGFIFRTDAVLPFTPGKQLVPFAAVGIGLMQTIGNSHTQLRPLFNYGAGVNYFLRKDLAFRADVRHVLVIALKGAGNVELSTGLSYYFDFPRKQIPLPVPEEKHEEKPAREKDGKPPAKESPSLPPLPVMTESKPGSVPVSAPGEAERPLEIAATPEPPQPAPPSSPSPPERAVISKCYHTLKAKGTVSRKQLEPLLKKLKAAGRQTSAREETRETEVFRLVTVCYPDMKSALRRQSELDRRYRDSFINPDGKEWCVIVGSYTTEEGALREQKRLKATGIPVRIVKAKVTLPNWRITSGRYATAQQAEEAGKILADMGIDTSVANICPPDTADTDGQIMVSELTVEFGLGDYRVNPKYYPRIKEIARILKSSPASTAEIEGHSDISGIRRDNLKLSRQRAESVKKILVKYGINPKRISARGMGPSMPVADNETARGRKLNRRAVEVVIVSH